MLRIFFVFPSTLATNGLGSDCEKLYIYHERSSLVSQVLCSQGGMSYMQVTIYQTLSRDFKPSFYLNHVVWCFCFTKFSTKLFLKNVGTSAASIQVARGKNVQYVM
jgi:hypothetical protein